MTTLPVQAERYLTGPPAPGLCSLLPSAPLPPTIPLVSQIELPDVSYAGNFLKSVRCVGILHPQAKRMQEHPAGLYRLLDGHRCLFCTLAAGLTELPVVIESHPDLRPGALHGLVSNYEANIRFRTPRISQPCSGLDRPPRTSPAGWTRWQAWLNVWVPYPKIFGPRWKRVSCHLE